MHRPDNNETEYHECGYTYTNTLNEEMYCGILF